MVRLIVLSGSIAELEELSGQKVRVLIARAPLLACIDGHR